MLAEIETKQESVLIPEVENNVLNDLLNESNYDFKKIEHTFIVMKAPEESNVPISPSSSSVHHSGRPSLSSSSPSLPARRRPPPWPSESRKSKSNFLRRLSPGPVWSRQPAERGPPSDKRNGPPSVRILSQVSHENINEIEQVQKQGSIGETHCPENHVVMSWGRLYLLFKV